MTDSAESARGIGQFKIATFSRLSGKNPDLSEKPCNHPKSAKTPRILTLMPEEMEDSQVERQWTKFQQNFTSAYNFTPSELENLGKLGMDLGPRIVWDILFVTMILVGVAGNLMVLWIVTGTDHFFSSNVPRYLFKIFLHVSNSLYFFSNLNSNCSNLSYLRNLQEQVKKAFCYQNLF